MAFVETALPLARPAPRRRPGGKPACGAAALTGDPRFRALMGDRAWNALKPAVRRRFAERLAAGESIVYVGQIAETQMNLAGRLLVQAARVIGSPFPLEPKAQGEAAVVALTAEGDREGQCWTRIYAWRRGFPQIVHSAKRFAGPTGLEEDVGYGIGVALTLHEENGGLRFCSAGYFLRLFGRRLPLPAFISPGQLVIGHDDLGQGRFTFTLQLTHPWLGRLLHQVALFHDTVINSAETQEAVSCPTPFPLISSPL